MPKLSINIIPPKQTIEVIGAFTRHDNGYLGINKHFLILKTQDGVQAEIWEDIFDEIQTKNYGYRSYQNLINSDLKLLEADQKIEKYLCPSKENDIGLLSTLHKLNLEKGIHINSTVEFPEFTCTPLIFTNQNDYLLFRFFNKEIGVEGETYDVVRENCILKDSSEETVKTICKT